MLMRLAILFFSFIEEETETQGGSTRETISFDKGMPW